MGEPASVVFRNVGQMYFPETRVDCHYSISSKHPWSCNDWVGLFQMSRTPAEGNSTFSAPGCLKCCGVTVLGSVV